MEAGGKVGALATAQIEVIDQAIANQLAAWGVTREEARAQMKFGELEKLGNVYKASVTRKINYGATTERFWGINWKLEFGELFPPWPSIEFTRMCSKVAVTAQGIGRYEGYIGDIGLY